MAVIEWPSSCGLASAYRKYLMQRIPEIAEVDVEDPDDLIDEGLFGVSGLRVSVSFLHGQAAVTRECRGESEPGVAVLLMLL